MHTIICIRVTASCYMNGNVNEVHAMRPVRMNIFPDHAVQVSGTLCTDKHGQAKLMTTDRVVILDLLKLI